MPPTRAASAASPPVQSPEVLAAAVEQFLADNAGALVLEHGKLLFDFASARYTVSADHGRCTLHLWSDERNLVRRVLAATPREGVLRLSTQRIGQALPVLLELCPPTGERRTPSQREAARDRYLRVLERVLERGFAPWKPAGFRTSMDLEHSFGPAYARGTLQRGRDAWAVIGVGAHESLTTVEAILTPGILWLHDCRARAAGRRLYTGLRLIVPERQSALTSSRLPWLNREAAQWELFELNERDETLTPLDPADQGNLRTSLVHRPDEASARDRFAAAIEAVRQLVPGSQWSRVEQRLRSSTELAFLLHGLQFARAKLVADERSFTHRVEIHVGAGSAEHLLPPATHTAAREAVAHHIAELFLRRRAPVAETDFGSRGLRARDAGPDRRIGSGVLGSAHRRTLLAQRGIPDRLPPAQDPLFRAVPERWLESVLRADLAPLTRSLGPDSSNGQSTSPARNRSAPDPDTLGNRADEPEPASNAAPPVQHESSRLIPRLDPRHVYTQVPAIAGASDRGLLDLLGVTEDGRLAVIELKTEDDLHMALQGLDYWIRVRHHHLASVDSRTGLGEFQRHGYFKDVELSPDPPRLYLVAPALHIHPATETVLRYLSARVEWHLLALDERWRQTVRVVWRKSSTRA